VVAHHIIERPGQTLASDSPSPDLSQMESPLASEILVRDRISPIVQLQELPLSHLVTRIVHFDLGPEVDAETAKICANAPRLGIEAFQLVV